MKKISAVILAMLLLIGCMTTAMAAKPGDTVTVNVSVTGNPDGAFAGRIKFSFDSSALTFVSASKAGDAIQAPATASGAFLLNNLSGLSVGGVGTLTFTVNENAAPGVYTVSVWAYDCVDTDENEVSISVAAGSVTVESTACTTHSWDNGSVTTEATCAKEGVKTYTCTACGETKTESIPKLTTHSWDNGTITTPPTCTEEGEKTYTCSVCKGTKTEAVAAAGHDDGEWVTITPATCKKDGLKELQCTVCGDALDSEAIPAAGIDHTEGEWATTTEPTCTTDGEKALTCSVCGEELDTEAIPATGHTEGEWATTTEPTCTADGEKALTCSVCGEELDTEAIPATGHTEGEWATTAEPTCTADGEKALTCSVCGEELDTEAVPATGHDDGEWVTVKDATCKEDGAKELQCTVCSAVLSTETIPAANAEHKPGAMVVTTEPTCTEAGEQTQSCTVCGEVLATEEIPSEGHDEGKWVTVKPATKEETGLKELHCTKCDELLDTAEIPLKTTDYYVRNTVCSIGPRFRDESKLTDAWYRFTPVDLSVDGVQTFDLIASDAFIIGQVTVTVANGTVTIDYAYVTDDVKEYSAFCTLLPSLADVTTLDIAQLTSYACGQPISIADELNGDTKVLLFICNVVDYNSEMPVTRVYPNSDEYQSLIDALRMNMD